MSNPPRKKGTAYETEVLRLLQQIWPEADRAKAGNFSCDIVGTPLDAVETKKRKTWCIPEWVRKIRTLGSRWMIFIGDGDRRSVTSVGDVVVVPRAFALELLASWETVNALVTDEET